MINRSATAQATLTNVCTDRSATRPCVAKIDSQAIFSASAAAGIAYVFCLKPMRIETT